MRDLFGGLTEHLPQSTWRPAAPPALSSINEIYLDCETTGLKWWDEHRPIGLGICLPDGSTQYLPWGHTGGGNLDEAVVKRWAERELRGKHIVNHNIRFDVHMLRQWGIDLEAQGNTVSDVSHYAALLDDHRYRFSQEELCKDYLDDTERKVLTVNGHTINPERMAEYHAGIIAVRAEADVRQVQKLKQVMWPLLDKEDLQRVRQLEDDVIYPVCEMEKNGALLDVDLLDRWVKESERELHGYLWKIYRDTGLKFNPKSPKDWEKLFQLRGIEITERTPPSPKFPNGQPSFSDTVLKKASADPLIQMGRHAGKLASLRSKYLLKDQATVDRRTGILRYALHQLRAQKSEEDDHGTGTVSGRFSSTEITEGVGQNIQQRFKVEKQRVSFGYDEDDDSHDEEIFIVRQLHIPAKDQLFLSADAQQIEYRLFAHYANNPAVVQAYQENPDLSFHKFVHKLLTPYKEDLTYRRCKDCSFCTLYGGGIKKLALMMEFITPKEFEYLRDTKASNSHPSLRQAVEIRKIYDQLLPEVKQLLKKASDLAEHRGYVKTMLGRRSRFPEKFRLHKAFNAVDQGTAADIMKTKLVELHRERKHTGFLLRFTVHDEVDGDVPDKESAGRVRAILNDQSFTLRVPIRWEVGTSPKNWAECLEVESQFDGADRTRSSQNIHDTHRVGRRGVAGEP